ncbi:MAG: 2'-5' RNA ligase family protein [Chitinophagaceae bacterium]
MPEEDIMKMPGYQYYEYMLVLQPHEELRNKILSARKDFSDAYQSISTSGGKPHVLIAKFTVWHMMEEKIINRLKVIAMGFAPFKAQIKDYGSFPSHTIYLNFTTIIPVKSLTGEIKKIKRLLKSPDHEPFFTNDPYIPIARKIKSEDYENAWKEYSTKHFTGSFIADGMLLLKRREGERAYQVAQRLEFMNLPVVTRQGSLFSGE